VVFPAVRQNVTIDWTVRENARANLRRYGYPPDMQEAATQLVLEQAEIFAREETTTIPLYRG
jgi:type I restriction enzyme, R subunit